MEWKEMLEHADVLEAKARALELFAVTDPGSSKTELDQAARLFATALKWRERANFVCESDWATKQTCHMVSTFLAATEAPKPVKEVRDAEGEDVKL